VLQQPSANRLDLADEVPAHFSLVLADNPMPSSL
jgi:hypothetical protein